LSERVHGATAIVPVKRFEDAKRRLLDSLDRRQRVTLVRGMLADMLAALTRATRVERVIVVTGERRAERIALERSRRGRMEMEVLRDPKDLGHSEAATIGIVRAKALGAGCAILLPGDCPLLDPGELDAALGRASAGRVAVVPDRHGTGTNALLLCPPDAIGPAFGPDSCQRHLERGRRAGHAVELEPLDSLSLDLDTPADLDELVAILRRGPARAPATTAALERSGLLSPKPR
jgi:2-phospho-L-lactate guanylyltransferase